MEDSVTFSLKPCPFCGGRALVHRHGIIFAECTACRGRTKVCSTVYEAGMAWNRRAYPEGTSEEDLRSFFENDANEAEGNH